MDATTAKTTDVGFPFVRKAAPIRSAGSIEDCCAEQGHKIWALSIGVFGHVDQAAGTKRQPSTGQTIRHKMWHIVRQVERIG
ncbi:hypothetical protein [Massilia sp. Root335]|uniref:hypothetical protein n=1 Tax=Massilia sp. Root335 TaxID=1736517 RepID=UPI0006F4D1B6|nr:hypothetical protein [Massilia sp. Root335]